MLEKNIFPWSTHRYCRRFGKIAADMGFVTAEQVKEALTEQFNDDNSNKRHRLIGEIMLMKGWMNPQQIDKVLNEQTKYS